MLDGELDADFWSSNSEGGNSIEVPFEDDGLPPSLGLVSGTSGRGVHATFAPQTLEIGDTLVSTATFTTPVTVGVNRSTALKVSLGDLFDTGLAASQNSSSSSVNPLYANLPAYMVDFDVNKTDQTDNTTMREHNLPNASGRYLGTTSEWTAFGSSSDEDGGYRFEPETEYVIVMSLTRTGEDTMDVFASLSQGDTVLNSNTATDESGIVNNIGILGYWVNSNTFGSNNSSSDPDNGITFSNVRVEKNPGGVIAEPTTEIVITSIDFDQDAGSVTIDWTAQAGTTYFVFASDDLVAFDEELSDVTAEAATATFTETGVVPGKPPVLPSRDSPRRRGRVDRDRRLISCYHRLPIRQVAT